MKKGRPMRPPLAHSSLGPRQALACPSTPEPETMSTYLVSRRAPSWRLRTIRRWRRQAFPTLIFLYDFRMWHRLAWAVIVAALASEPANAQESPAQFYKGKQITVIVGSSAGGGYDIYARLLARHMPKHIPGNPAMVVTNMAGAGSNAAA